MIDLFQGWAVKSKKPLSTFRMCQYFGKNPHFFLAFFCIRDSRFDRFIGADADPEKVSGAVIAAFSVEADPARRIAA
jgi:hypothetical protein